ncbi:hypothetical protein AWENTII_008242 [Aspergillus wentii]|nr:hypothetical protein MW887_008177 [Aspergillus wentii]
MYPIRQSSYGPPAPTGRSMSVSSTSSYSQADRVYLMSRNHNGAITRHGPYAIEHATDDNRYTLRGNDSGRVVINNRSLFDAMDLTPA